MAADEADDGRLLTLYRQYVGEPNRPTDVYAGFAFFFGGFALGTLGLLIFIWSTAVPASDPFFWQLRELALVLAFFGLPVFVTSIVVLLPVSKRIIYASAGGTVLCLLAIAIFVAVYPANWNVQGTADYSLYGITVYAAGLTVLVGATGSALVAHHLEQAAPTIGVERAGEEGSGPASPANQSGAATESYSDEQIRRDIEEATESVDLTWGGVERTETSKRLKIRASDGESDVDISGMDSGAATESRSGGVDDAVAGLRALQGGDREVGTGEGTDEQTAALTELRERQEAEAVEQPDSVFERVRHRFGFD